MLHLKLKCFELQWCTCNHQSILPWADHSGLSQSKLSHAELNYKRLWNATLKCCWDFAGNINFSRMLAYMCCWIGAHVYRLKSSYFFKVEIRHFFLIILLNTWLLLFLKTLIIVFSIIVALLNCMLAKFEILECSGFSLTGQRSKDGYDTGWTSGNGITSAATNWGSTANAG